MIFGLNYLHFNAKIGTCIGKSVVFVSFLFRIRLSLMYIY